MAPTPPVPSFLLCLLFSFLLIFTTSLSVPISPLDSRETWNAAVRKGTVLYQQLQSGCFPDLENPITVPELVARGWAFDGTGGSVWPPVPGYWDGFSQFVVRTMGWTDNSDYYVKGIRYGYSQEWQQYTSYHNMYSPRNALIAAITTHRLAAEPIHWSDATFAMWAAIAAFDGRDIRDLRYIGQASINNRLTASIINRAVPDRAKSATVFRADTKAFLALLGTPNGAGGVYLLMQHKRALGLKTFVRAVVIRDGGWEYPHVVFEVAGMSSPSWQSGPVVGPRGDDDGDSLIAPGLRGGCGGGNGTAEMEMVADE